MIAKPKPLVELTSRAFEIRSRDMGVVDTIRFINRFHSGFGDDTAERDALIGHLTMADVHAEIGATSGTKNAQQAEND